jgi:hypothetical protein
MQSKELRSDVHVKKGMEWMILWWEVGQAVDIIDLMWRRPMALAAPEEAVQETRIIMSMMARQ